MSVWQAMWEELRKEPLQGDSAGDIVRRRVFPDVQADIFAGVEYSSGVPLLLLRIPRALIPSKDQLPEGDGFTVTPVIMSDDGADAATLILRLTDSCQEDIFSVLAEDIASSAAKESDVNGAIDIFLSRLVAWQRFLLAHGHGGLGRESQQGLYGELWCLKTLLLPNMEWLEAVESWTGPCEAVHDFQLPYCAIEVKTSSANQLQAISISNERQLDDAHVPALWLLHVSLDISQTGGESLGEMVEWIRALISEKEVAREGFNDRLWRVGYLDAHYELYQKTRYHLREYNIFRVREGFPRIIESDLQPGVGNVRYSVSVAECKHFVADEVKFIANLQEGQEDNGT